VSVLLASFAMRPILRSNKAQKAFVENASHELRTPLAVIQSKLELLFQKPDASILESSDEIGESLAEIRRLRNLATDLLRLTREEQTLEVVRAPFKIYPLFQTLSEDFQMVAVTERKHFAFQFEGDVEADYIGDKEKIQQITVILLENAMKYTSETESIGLKVSLGKELEITVTDTGIGIPKEMREVIFQRFIRLDDSRNLTQGFGLGLSILSQLLEAMGGKVEVRENAPKGSQFVVRI
jgi:two-component system sensor histidine kinase CiaH